MNEMESNRINEGNASKQEVDEGLLLLPGEKSAGISSEGFNFCFVFRTVHSGITP